MAKKYILDNQDKINADIALKNRLYVSGYLLSGLLVKIRSGIRNAKVVLHYKNEIPVGVAVRVEDDNFRFDDYNMMVFVRKSERRKGIGSKLVKQLNRNNAIVGRGCDASWNFWHKTGVVD